MVKTDYTPSLDCVLKLLVLLTSLFHVGNFSWWGNSQKEPVIFVKNIWLPQLVVALVLLLTNSLSWVFLRKKDALFLYGDVFFLTTVEKLVIIGYNIHLIIFFATLSDIDVAFTVLPISVFSFFILDSAVVIAYLDTVFFGILDWQKYLLDRWSIGFKSSILVQHILCSYLYFHHSSMGVQFMKTIYKYKL